MAHLGHIRHSYIPDTVQAFLRIRLVVGQNIIWYSLITDSKVGLTFYNFVTV